MELIKIIARYVFPSVRRRLAIILSEEYNLKQIEIARMTFIKQSTISKYLNAKRAGFLDLSKAPRTDKRIREIAHRIYEGKMDKYDLEYELTLTALRAIADGEICRFHKEMDVEVTPELCEVCRKLFAPYRSDQNFFEK
ncbi:MAG: transcriptional regulator [Candidatus Njordarchaeia archaeon]